MERKVTAKYFVIKDCDFLVLHEIENTTLQYQQSMQEIKVSFSCNYSSQNYVETLKRIGVNEFFGRLISTFQSLSKSAPMMLVK